METVSKQANSNIELKLKLIQRHKKGHFFLLKKTVIQKDIIILNIYVSNSEVPNLMTNLPLNLQILANINPKTVGYFNTTLSSTDRSSKQKVNRKA